jgi:hypothetical protein
MDRHDFDKHFLDSNVLIGFIIKWDSSNSDCYDYFKEKTNKTVSKRVYNECKRVINRCRRMEEQFLSGAYDYFQGKNLLKNFRRQLNYFTMEYIEKQEDNAFGISKEKFTKFIRAFTDQCYGPIFNAMIDYSLYTNFAEEIAETFKGAMDELDNICYTNQIVKVHKEPAKSYKNIFPNFESELNKMGIHKPDNLIILDCYYFKCTYLKEDMAFITSDKGILNVNLKIQEFLDGIYVHSLT